jgi:hypothetical protein
VIEYLRAPPCEVRPCSCGRQPKVVELRGRHETLRFDLPARQYRLECCPCGASTALATTLQEALQCWDANEISQRRFAA